MYSTTESEKGGSKLNREEQIEADNLMLDRIERGEIQLPGARRILKEATVSKRGCKICIYMRKISRFELTPYERAAANLYQNQRVMTCPFDHCPLHETDKYQKYGDFDRERERKYWRWMAKLTQKRVEKKEEPKEQPYIDIDDRMRWMIRCRVSQGARIDHIMSEFGIKNRKQAEEEMEVARGK